MALPTLRLVAAPEWGLACDGALRLGAGLDTYISAESYLSGRTLVGFGLQPRGRAWLRLQLVPAVKCIVRVPLARFSRHKYLLAGAEATLYPRSASEAPQALQVPNSPRELWKALTALCRPAAEVVHRNDLVGMLLSEQQRKKVAATLRQVEAATAAASARRRLVDSRSLLDPDAMERSMRERMEMRRREGVGPGPELLDDLKLDRLQPRNYDGDFQRTMPPQGDFERSFRPPAFLLATFNGTRAACLGP